MVAEATGGPTWYTEFNVLTGMSVRSFGDLKFYVTRITAGRVTRGLPQALQRCGYKTVSLYRPGPGEPRDDHERVARHGDGDVLEVVLAGARDDDLVLTGDIRAA